jgi:threonine aldolase
VIDLRSDTVTRPTAAMRQAIANAEVGDDVLGEDPTVLRLQERAAALLGKEAALFVPSGSMANQLAIRVHTQPGDEVICEAGCHIFNYESGGAGALSGVQLRPLQGHRGGLTAALVSAAIRNGYSWEPQSRLICVENTASKAGGTVHIQQDIIEIGNVARNAGLAFHMDGARIWNASVASGLDVSELAAPFDTVSACLSKGLGAPVGSVLAGTAELISRAHRWRGVFGAGMRQVGIIAAGGLHALEHHRGDLHKDHARARTLAEALSLLPGISLDPSAVETNIIMFDVVAMTAASALEKLKTEGVLMVAYGPQTIRATTHRDLGDDHIARAMAAAKRVFA